MRIADFFNIANILQYVLSPFNAYYRFTLQYNVLYNTH